MDTSTQCLIFNLHAHTHTCIEISSILFFFICLRFHVHTNPKSADVLILVIYTHSNRTILFLGNGIVVGSAAAIDDDDDDCFGILIRHLIFLHMYLYTSWAKPKTSKRKTPWAQTSKRVSFTQNCCSRCRWYSFYFEVTTQITVVRHEIWSRDGSAKHVHRLFLLLQITLINALPIN